MKITQLIEANEYEWRVERNDYGRMRAGLYRNGQYAAEFAYKEWPANKHQSGGAWTYSSTSIGDAYNDPDDDSKNTVSFGTNTKGFPSFAALNAFVMKKGRPSLESMEDALTKDDAMDIVAHSWTDFTQSIPFALLDRIKQQVEALGDGPRRFTREVAQAYRWPTRDIRITPKSIKDLEDYFDGKWTPPA